MRVFDGVHEGRVSSTSSDFALTPFLENYSECCSPAGYRGYVQHVNSLEAEDDCKRTKCKPEKYGAGLLRLTPTRQLCLELLPNACMRIVSGVLASWFRPRRNRRRETASQIHLSFLCSLVRLDTAD